MKYRKIFESARNAFKSLNTSNRCYLVTVVLLIAFSYLPTLQEDFVYNDQWRTFQYGMLDESPSAKAQKCFRSRLLDDFSSGRPLLCVGECMEHAWAGKISDFSATRPLVLMLVVLTAFLVGKALSPSLGGMVNGTAIGALFVLSPGYAHMYYLGLSAIMMLIALVSATLAYMLIRRAIIKNFSKTDLFLAFALFFAACMIYPAWAFVVFIFALTDFLFCEEPEMITRLKHLFIKVFFFAAVSGTYYLFVKLMTLILPATSMNVYVFSANFDPLYLSKRFIIAVLYYLAQPPLNTLYVSLNILNIIFLLVVAAIFSILFLKKSNHKCVHTVFSLLLTMFLCVFLIFVSIAPWLLSNMSGVGNRCLVPFSLFMCILVGWVIFRLSDKLFSTKKYVSTILLVFIVLLPASAIQNKRSSFEVGIKGAEISAMRLAVHQWIDDNSFTKNRFIVVVKPKRPRPLFYDNVLNNVMFGGSIRILGDARKNLTHRYNMEYDDTLLLFKMVSRLMQENKHLPVWARFNQVLSMAAGYGESLEFCGDPSYYFQMFTAVIREKCDRYHPLGRMNFYNISSMQELVLDYNPLNIVFTVINQGDSIKTKHNVLEINFSLITNLPEPLHIIYD